MKFLQSVFPRRSIIRFGGTAGALALALAPEARGQRSSILGWAPAREEKDDWLDKVSISNRLMDSCSAALMLSSARRLPATWRNRWRKM